MKTFIVMSLIIATIFVLYGNSFAGINDGLIAYYPFNGNANDESGNGHHGTVYGAFLSEDRFGNQDRAYGFDGNGWIEVPDDPRLTFGSNPFTVVAWVQFSDSGGYYLMGHSEGPGYTNKWIFYLEDSRIGLADTHNDWILLDSPIITLGRWYHVAMRREGNVLTFFIDGEEVGTAAMNNPIPDPAAPFRIGTAEFDRANRQFRGLLDDVRLYSRALTDDEIKSMLICDEEGAWGTVNGTVRYYDTSLCTLVLANGQYMFSCDDDLGIYDLYVPIDDNCEITLQIYSSGFAPYRAVLSPLGAQDFEVVMTRAPANSREIEVIYQTEPGTENPNWMRINGTVAYEWTPLCTMVLANGQKMFSCGDDIGTFDLEVPLDGNGEITLYVFCSGFAPYKNVFVP